MSDFVSQFQQDFLPEDGPAFDRPVSFQGVVTRIIFRNEDNGYTIAEILDGTEEWTAVGVMPYLAAGEHVSGEGTLVDHPTYGPQIKVEAISREEPLGRVRIEKYLASGAVKGVGPATAKKLVATFGDDTLTVMRLHPEKVARIRGVGPKKAESFSQQLKDDRAYQELLLMLLPHGIGPLRIHRIYQLFGMGAVDQIAKNPYELARRVPGIGFRTADVIAQGLGIAGDHPARLSGAILFWMNQLLFRDGHTVLSEQELIRVLSQQLEVDPLSLLQALHRLIEEGQIVRPHELRHDGKKEGKWSIAARTLVKDSVLGTAPEPADAGQKLVALQDVSTIERAIAKTIRELCKTPLSGKKKMTKEEAMEAIDSVAKAEAFQLGEKQVDAMVMALTKSFSVLTGGPGTGKTAIVRLLTGILQKRGETVLLAAPTGRAARRLGEVCRMPAQTLHRLLTLQVQDDKVPDAAFWLSAEPLLCDTLIVDECSMIDLFLFANLLSAVRPGTRVLLIGDADQLPSIGPGQVLRDILASQTVTSTRLVEIYRQESHKLIVSNAHKILKGDSLELDQSLESDFMFIDSADEEAMLKGVLKLCRDVLPNYYATDGVYGVQVLSALRRGMAGVDELNRQLQELAQGPSFFHLEHHGQKFAVGDKVILTRNNYNLAWKMENGSQSGQGVMNGETGIVRAISQEAKSVTVFFEEERIAVVESDDLLDLELAYAITIHKAQGSEYPVEILVIPSSSPSFLTRNLLYTGVTRARERLFLLTRKRTLSMMLNNNEANERRGMLKDWLKAL